MRNDSQPAISVTGLTKQFGARTAFENVSLDVDCGEVFGFLGPNGAGKTTMVRTLGALIAPTSGSATVAGLPLTPENAVSIRERISVMPESPGLYLRLSVAENLECFAGLYGISDPGGRIGRALAAVGLTDRAQEPCGKLSKGLRQRVSLARALLNDAEVVFLDEPTSGLDPAAAREVYAIIEGLRERGRAVFLTTHRLAEAERLCDRVALLNTTLRATGTPDELRAQLRAAGLDVATRLPLTDPDQILLGVPGVAGWELTGPAAYLLTVSDADAVAPAIVRALVAAGADVRSVTPRRPSLEDVYLTLIRDDETGVS